MLNPGGLCLGLGPSVPWIGLWMVVKTGRLGDMKIPHGVGGEIQWHPCLFLPIDLGEIIAKPIVTYLLYWPSDPRWIAVNLDFY